MIVFTIKRAKMKKHISLLLLGFSLVFQLFAQPVVETPEQYEAVLSYYEDFVKLQMQEHGYDYSIPPGERVRFSASAKSLNQGSWPTRFHQTYQNASWIAENAQGKVVIFLLDTGAGFSNSRLNQAWWRGKEKVFTGESTRIDQQSHSTHCSGIIGAVDMNKPIGLAEELVKLGLLKIIPYKVLNDQGFAYTNWIVAGIEDVIQVAPALQAQGWRPMISLSLGGRGQSEAMDEVINRAEAAGILVFAAAGNDSSSEVSTPANGPGAIAVAAHDEQGRRANFSNYGPEIETAGGGVRVLSTLPNEEEGEYSGTSMATPAVVACAAIIASTHPKLTPNQIKSVLYTRVFDPAPEGRDDYTGHGSFQLGRLIDNPVDGTPPDPEDPDNPTEPEEPTPPDFTSTVTYEISGEKKYYRSTSETRYHKLSVEPMEVTVTGTGNSNAVYDRNDTWTNSYFKRVRMVVPDTPEWGHCDNTYWTGQFYEYISRQDGIGAQVSKHRGVDEDGRNCVEYTFDRASITSYQHASGKLVLQAMTDQGPVTLIAWPKRRGWFRRIFTKP